MTDRRSVVAVGLMLAVSGLLFGCGLRPSSSPASRPTGVSSAPAKNAAGYTDLTVEQLTAMLPAKNFTLVNVHIPYEGELPQTDAFIPFDEIGQHLDELPAKDAPIVLYCRSGRMSTEAAERLAKLGYSNVMELDGGFREWQSKGYEFLDDPTKKE